jgi:hypothetical protein
VAEVLFANVHAGRKIPRSSFRSVGQFPFFDKP